MKIAIIGNTANAMILFRIDLIKMLNNKGIEVYAFATDYDDFSREKISSYGGIPVDYDFNRSSINPIMDLLNTYALSKKLKKINPDITLSFFAKPAIFGCLAGLISGVKNNNAMLEGLGYLFTDQPYRISLKTNIIKRIQVLLYKLIFPHINSLILLNNDDYHDLIKKNKIKTKKTHILGGIGLDLNSYVKSVPPTDKISFIFIARLLAEKGINEYVAAAKKIKQTHPDVEFIILGDIDKENPGSLSESDVDNLIKSGVITYPGFVSNVAEWIKRSSVFVLPSYYREGVPRSTQEAMAIGRPILTTNLPGCKETIIDGVNGYVVKPCSHEDLTEKMLRLINNPERIIQMGEESHKLACKKFNANINNKKLLKFLDISN
ncbi:glycosyltransferase family 4 protein (plasmid) [Arsenophonus nasoniae]|uniref:Glycosyltransferase family 4 protein n=1 Tax=Arsenophonus nasoniae TaxID=638 RepID=A0A4P7L3V0_9GAMM|nr:glycosyltransferase family 4 protein [Arsenophonus nasoniae]QBY45770.1 N,N'-diacetylbacillosaminyl-diphospho-undecaprenol alpha-1,3-N-acetylgalactosaminyltransferase [Arsenophonus nasoniae]WGM08023.1 glycosyltransferase family 4 protein [Arsenophonus nasoniae]WGM12835.1 glycosyltransferase family 4 protein [Arsenophonus nasoniae]WGM17543.1 glycosyltransferase family 4 protein [Arsenophonus nasoniae]